MDRQEFDRLVFEKLSAINPTSIKFMDESGDAVTIEVISDDFIGVSLLKRINRVFELLASLIKAVDFNVDFVILTVNEKEKGLNEQNS
jgi:stress-induced morphogen